MAKGTTETLETMDRAESPVSRSSKAFEEWAADKGLVKAKAPEDWRVAALRAHTRWGQGKVVTEAEFDQALDSVLGLKIGGGPAPESPPTKR